MSTGNPFAANRSIGPTARPPASCDSTIRPQPAETLGYSGWDVHSYTSALKERMSDGGDVTEETLRVLTQPVERGSLLDALGLVQEELARTDTTMMTRNNAVRATVRKMLDRMIAGDGDYIDGELVARRDPVSAGGVGDARPAGLRSVFVGSVLVWCSALMVKQKDLWPLFFEIMVDVGQTCVQGDSHRLLGLGLTVLDDISNPKTT